MKRFLLSHAGRGTVGIYLACLIIAVPDALKFLIAGAAILWSLQHFRLAFAEPAAGLRLEPVIDPATQLGRAGDRCPSVILRPEPARPAFAGAGLPEREPRLGRPA